MLAQLSTKSACERFQRRACPRYRYSLTQLTSRGCPAGPRPASRGSRATAAAASFDSMALRRKAIASVLPGFVLSSKPQSTAQRATMFSAACNASGDSASTHRSSAYSRWVMWNDVCLLPSVGPPCARCPARTDTPGMVASSRESDSTYMLKNRGLRTQPCAVPPVVANVSEMVPLARTALMRPLWQVRRVCSSARGTPACPRISQRAGANTVSYARRKSTKSA